MCLQEVKTKSNSPISFTDNIGMVELGSSLGLKCEPSVTLRHTSPKEVSVASSLFDCNHSAKTV